MDRLPQKGNLQKEPDMFSRKIIGCDDGRVDSSYVGPIPPDMLERSAPTHQLNERTERPPHLDVPQKRELPRRPVSMMERYYAPIMEKPKEEGSTGGDQLISQFNVEPPKIIVMGCGGAGNNSLNRLKEQGLTGATTMAINTDRQQLHNTTSNKKVLIGTKITEGMGTGGDHELGKRCAEASKDVLEDQLEGTNLLFITAGLGGGTGTGASPVIADLAHKQGAIVVSIVSMPFTMERARCQRAAEGLRQLREHSDCILVLDNNRLLKMVPNLPLQQAFSIMDELISQIVKGIIETITQPSLINIDFADLRNVMSNGGMGIILYGEGDVEMPQDVIDNTLNNPLLDVGFSNATGALIHISGGNDLSLKLAQELASGMTEKIGQEANVILGARVDPALTGRLQIIAVITGIKALESQGASDDAGQDNGSSFDLEFERRQVAPEVEVKDPNPLGDVSYANMARNMRHEIDWIR